MSEPTLAFTTRETQRLTGLTARKLQYWDETGFIRPSVAARKGRGAPRLYGFRDLVQLRVAAQLRDLLSLQALRRLKTALNVDAPFASVRFGITKLGEVVYLGPSGQHESATSPGQIVMTFDVPLLEIRGELESGIRKLRERHGAGRIERRKGTLGGAARIAGTRISAAAIARLIDAGWTLQEIQAEYPEIEAADIKAAHQTQKRAG